MQIKLKKDGRRLLCVLLASGIMALNIKSFVRTGGLYPGGATGLTILIQTVAARWFGAALPFSIINLLLNSVPVYIGFKYIGRRFTLYSCIMILVSSVLVDILPAYIITYNTLLISIFGGLINGTAITLCLRANATSGGTDFISIYLSEKHGTDSWNVILAINVVILTCAGALSGWDKALYSMIFQYTTTQVLRALYRRYQKETLFVVTNKPDDVCSAIYSRTGHGATIIRAEGSYGHAERDIVYSVISADESKQIIRVVREADPQAFVNSIKTEEVRGRFYQRPND